MQDTGIRWGAPTVDCKNSNGKYLENAQTEPDIKVKLENEKVSLGNYQQLEIALKELMKETK